MRLLAVKSLVLLLVKGGVAVPVAADVFAAGRPVAVKAVHVLLVSSSTVLARKILIDGYSIKKIHLCVSCSATLVCR